MLPCGLIAAGGLLAQDVESPDDDTLFELSPFAVDAGEHVGYRATSTLAGTRIRTNLRDVGASISVVTEEFLDDSASQNLEDVLIYTSNTEVGGLGGNFSGSQGFGLGSVIPELQRDTNSGGITRVRGLASADLTRDFFITDVPFDSYNTDRITVQRGANATLFGLGSPGGVINNNLIKADFNGDRGRIRFQTDEHGTQRFSFRSHNELIDNTWSIFTAGLYGMKQFEQNEAFEKDRRIYLSTLWEPVDNLRIRASIEYGYRDRTPPRTEPPNDLISPWVHLGRPTFSHPAEAGAFRNASGDLVAGESNSAYIQQISAARQGPMTVYGDPGQAEPTMGVQAWINANQNTTTDEEWGMMSMRNPQDIAASTGFWPDGTPIPAGSGGFFGGGFSKAQITDRSIFDYRKHLLDGGASQSWADFRDMIITVERTWDRFGFELAAHRQDMTEGQLNQLRGGDQSIAIGVDMNEFMGVATDDGTLDGNPTPNPNFGRPYIVARGEHAYHDRDRTNFRATAFGEIHFDDFVENDRAAMVLGRLNLTGLASHQEYRDRTLFSRNGPGVNISGQLEGVDGGNLQGNTFRTHDYYALPMAGADTLLNATSMDDVSGARIGPIPFGQERATARQTLQSRTYQMWNPGAQAFTEVDTATHTVLHGDGSPATFSASKSRTEVESQVAIAQHYLFNDKLVLQGSWRKDTQRVYNAPTPGGLSGYGDGRRDLTDPAWEVPGDTPNSRASGQIRSWGVVAHSPDFVNDRLPAGTDFSIHYSENENFEPTAGRRDSYGNPLPPVTGETEEFGFTVSTLDGRLITKVNWYETGIFNNSFQNSAIAAPEAIMLNLARQLDNPDNTAQGFTAADAQAVLPPQSVIDLHGVEFDWDNADAMSFADPARVGTQDFVSDGLEIEVSYNPTPNWTTQLGIARQQTETSNTYPVLQQLFEDVFEPLWINSDFAQNFYIDDTSEETLAQRTIRQIQNNIIVGQAQDGFPTVEQRKWRVVASTSYRIDDYHEFLPSWMSGLTVGGSLRWEDSAGIGFGVTTDEFGDTTLDLGNTFSAPSQTFIDVFARYEWELDRGNRLAFQVNVKDLTNHNGLVPIFANPDGTKVYRIQEGRLVSASATLHF
ncbi:MAG: TonB-dependent receptor plug domain-containing protein [Opitutales bacterium]|nr:TonB-dependent receptor plug domain-containing protein [Opitutales bacterium]